MIKREAGITLIELLVVVSVIGILIGVVVVVVDPNKSQGRARDGVRVSYVKSVSETIESYRHMEGAYPPDEEDEVLLTYLKKWPDPVADDGSVDYEDPYWKYTYSLVGDDFLLFSNNSRGGCYKYQSNWSQVLECEESDCNDSLSDLSNCKKLL